MTEAKIVPCSDEEKWNCVNFKSKEGDTDMNYEHYECKVCGQCGSLDYEEMR